MERMKQGQDITARFPGIFIIHQKIRGNAVNLHRHDEHEVFLPLQGEIRIQAGEISLKAGPGKMIYLPPGVDHTFRSSSSAQGERLIFILEDKTWKACNGGAFPPLSASASQLSKELLFHLLIYPKTRAAAPLIETLVQTLSEVLESSALQIKGELAHLDGRTNDTRIKNALGLIREQYAIPLSMETLAKSAALSTRNLNRLFLQELGMTPKQLITLHRIENAKRLLRKGSLSVTDVAFEVGYNSVSQFITTFRKATGQLPSDLTR